MNQQFIDKILNKQFKKTAFAGYDTIDVDSFFDLVIDYLKSNDKSVEEYKAKVDKLVNDNIALAQKIKSLQTTIASQKQLISKYELEGYGNVMTAKRLANMEMRINELEDKKNGK